MGEHDLHHLESASVYAEHMPNYQRPAPPIPEDGPSTPRYEVPNEQRNISQIMYGGLINPIPYNGSTDPRQWLSYYSDVSDANLWSEDVKFKRLISCLEDAPLQWYRNEKQRNPTFNWTQFRRGLIEKYTNECDSFLSELNIMRRVQERNEPFNSYWENKRSLIELTAPQMSTKEKITQLFNGLRKELYDRVLPKYMATKPETLEEMYKLIKRADDAINFSQLRGKELSNTQQTPREYVKQPYTGKNFNQKDGQRFRKQGLGEIKGLVDEYLSQQLSKIGLAEGQNAKNRTVRFTEPKERANNDFRSNNGRNYGERNKFSNNTGTPSNQSKFQGRPMEEVQCWHCNDFGHFANRCPKKVAYQKNERQQN